MGLIHSPSVVTNGLVFCVDAANKKSYPGSGASCNDIIGGKVGTLAAGASYSSSNVGVFDFTGANGFVSLPASTFVNLAGVEGTFCYWIKFPAGDAVTRYLFDDGGGWPNQVFLYRNDFWTANQWAWAIYYTDTSNNTGWHIQSLTYTPNTWFMTSMTYSTNGQQRVYINNTLSYTGNPTNFASWKRSGTNQPFFGGGGTTTSAAALLHYNRALSAAEITQNFNAMRGRFGV